MTIRISVRNGRIGRWSMRYMMSQILAERIIHSMLDLTTIVNCFKGIGDDLEIGIYRGLKLKDQILKIVERVVEELKWINELKQAEMNEMQFGFTEGCGTQGVILILKMLSHVTLNLCLVENSKIVHVRCLLFAQKCKMCGATYWSEILMCILFHDNFTLSKMAKNLENGVKWRFNLLLLFSLTSIFDFTFDCKNFLYKVLYLLLLFVYC